MQDHENKSQDTNAPTRKKTPERILLAIGLSIVSAVALATILRMRDPDFFGSCFEGSCGYMAMFVFSPIVTIVLIPVWWMMLRFAGPITFLALWLLLWTDVGWLALPRIVWLIGIAIMIWQIGKRWQAHKAQGKPMRELFIKL